MRSHQNLTTSLLLGGWLLMAPPSGHDKLGELKVFPGAPLREWGVDRAFDTARECEERRTADQGEAIEVSMKMMSDPEFRKLSEAAKGPNVFSPGEAVRRSQAEKCVPAEHIYPPKK